MLYLIRKATLTILLIALTVYAATAPDATSNSKPSATERQSGLHMHSPEMEKLERLIAGAWTIHAVADPSTSFPKQRRGAGRSVIRIGPGGRSLIEDYRQHGDDGYREALGMFWWDNKAKGYRMMFCDSRDPDGCSLYPCLGGWKGDEVIFNCKDELNGKTVVTKEVLSPRPNSSFVATFYRGENGGSLRRFFTVTHNRMPGR